MDGVSQKKEVSLKVSSGCSFVIIPYGREEIHVQKGDEAAHHCGSALQFPLEYVPGLLA